MTRIEFRKSKLHGNGVFATTEIKKDETIEICPVITLNKKETKIIDQTFLYNYYFGWSKGGSAIALGYGSLYNHAYHPNAQYKKDFLNRVIVFTSIKDIKKSEEITVNYNGDPLSQEKVWFDKER